MIRYTNSPPPNRKKTAETPPPKQACVNKEKNLLCFLPKEIYNPKTRKFFGLLSGDDILIIGLILMILDNGEDDLFLILALLYILLSDRIDLGNILK